VEEGFPHLPLRPTHFPLTDVNTIGFQNLFQHTLRVQSRERNLESWMKINRNWSVRTLKIAICYDLRDSEVVAFQQLAWEKCTLCLEASPDSQIPLNVPTLPEPNTNHELLICIW
jgi:hypothetical protein